MSKPTNLKSRCELVSLGDIVTSRAGKTPDRSNAAYWGGTTPWVTAKDLKTLRLVSGQEHITDDAVHKGAPIAKPGDVLVLVRGMTLLKDVPIGLVQTRMSYNQDVRCLHPSNAVSGEYLAFLLSAARDRLLSVVTQAGHGTGRLDTDQLLATTLLIPSRETQDWVVERILPLASAAACLQFLVVAKRALKRGLMQELLQGPRRLPGFRHERIRRVPLGDHTTELSGRNSEGWGAERVMGVSKGIGLEPMRDHVRAADLSRYKAVPPDAFAYNPMRLNIGSIARSHLAHDCLVSPDYVVFRTDPDTLLPAYLDQLRYSHIWNRFTQPAGSGSVRVRIYFRDLAEMQIPLPSLDEQRSIARVLDGLDREIALLEDLRKAYALHERALMQRVLSGDLRVPVRHRATKRSAHA